MIIDVAAAVIQRGDGYFLLARRPEGKPYAGYWEFPGGKVEPGEHAETALARELEEELGIEVQCAYPWITRVFTYPHGTVRLRFFRVLQWRNDPHPKEDQVIAWQAPGGATVAPMLPANAPVLAALTLPAEYAITSAGRLGVEPMLRRLLERLEGGLRLVQVREPGLANRQAFTEQVIALAHRYGCKVMVKEPHDKADGIHYTAEELMRLKQRPQGVLAAASCHSREELERAMQLELDFAVVGPVREKGEARVLGWDGFRRLIAGASLPVYAIGGLTAEDLRSAWVAGAHGVAMIRGAWS